MLPKWNWIGIVCYVILHRMASLKASWNVNVVVYSDFDSRYLLYFLRRQKAFFFKITLSTFQFFHLQKCFYKKKIDTEFQVTFKITLQVLLYTCWTNKIKRIGFFLSGAS